MLGNTGQCHCLYHQYQQPWPRQLLGSAGTGFDPSFASQLPSRMLSPACSPCLFSSISSLLPNSLPPLTWCKDPCKAAGHPCSPLQPGMVPITSPGCSASRPCRKVPPPALRVPLPALQHLLALTPAVLGSQGFGSARLPGSTLLGRVCVLGACAFLLWALVSGQGPSLASA